jgi:hypothetical protein
MSPSLNAELKRLLAMTRNHGVDEVPEGWWTVSDFAAANSISNQRAREVIPLLANKLETRKFRIQNGDRKGAYPVVHYRHVKKATSPARLARR